MKGVSELKKELNLLEITLVGIGNILGAGIYVLMGEAAGLAGNMVWFVVITSSAVAPRFGRYFSNLFGNGYLTVAVSLLSAVFFLS